VYVAAIQKRDTLTGHFYFACLFGSMKSVIDRYTKAKEEQPAGLDVTSQTKVCVFKSNARDVLV
jgi:hypothetical protein